MRRGGEARIPTSAAPTARYQESLTRGLKVVQQFVSIGVIDDRTHGSLDIDRPAFVPGSVAAFAVPSALGFVLGVKTKMEKGVLMRRCDQIHVAATAAVAAARTASRNKLLPPKGQAAVPAVSGFDG